LSHIEQDKESAKKSDKPVYAGNSIMVRPDGPLICKGDSDIILKNANGDVIAEEKEFALCRCGLSKTKPFCDGSHKRAKVKLTQDFNDKRTENITMMDESLTITVKENAMYSVVGSVTIFSRDGRSKTTRTKAALCRCGFSENKPFCDIKHKKHGFIA